MDEAVADPHVLQTLTTYSSDVNSIDFAGDCLLVTGSGWELIIGSFEFEVNLKFVINAANKLSKRTFFEYKLNLLHCFTKNTTTNLKNGELNRKKKKWNCKKCKQPIK